MGKTKISWTDRVWNPIVGCNKISSGCKNCYAKSLHDKRHKAFKEGKLQNIKQYAKPFEEIQLMYNRLNDPLKWRKPCRVFVNSISDLFHEDVPFEFIDEVFSAIAFSIDHIFQILTKRPKRMAEYFKWSEYCKDFEKVNGVWLGVSIEELLKILAKVRWLSIEPMLGDINLGKYFIWCNKHGINIDKCAMSKHYGEEWRKLDWVVVGAESGHNRRECKIEWIESIVEQCKSANVPVFVKQIHLNGELITDINQFPKHLQIQEHPK
jgi:protein gp37